MLSWSLFVLPQNFRAVGEPPAHLQELEPPEALVKFHKEIWNNQDAHNGVFSTMQVERDGSLTDLDIPSQCCVMGSPHLYSAPNITSIIICNEYVQAIKDIIALCIDERSVPDADNNEGSDNKADVAMHSGDVGLDEDMVMETSVPVAEPSAPAPFPCAIDNPFLGVEFPPRPRVIVTGSPGIGEYSG